MKPTYIPFNIEVDKSGQQTAKERIVVPQEKSTRHREPSASKQRQKSASKERKQKEKPRKRESSSLTISGSLDLDNISSRGLDSFSASLPRTCPSTDWQEMSQDATFSPIKPAYQTSFIELRKELVTRGTQSELSGDDLQIIGKGIFVIKTASPKKKRPITKEEMLYGETSMHVGPTGRETEHDIMAMDDKSVSSSRSDQVHLKLGFLPELSLDEFYPLIFSELAHDVGL